jgi:hypothetical protein
MSIPRSFRGREQQINRFPAAGGSSGSGSYSTNPEINPRSQVWQTRVRQDRRTGRSHASASWNRSIFLRHLSFGFLGRQRFPFGTIDVRVVLVQRLDVYNPDFLWARICRWPGIGLKGASSHVDDRRDRATGTRFGPGLLSDLPLSIEKYEQLVGSGVFTKHDKLQLINGRLAAKVKKTPPHAVANDRCRNALSRFLPTGWSIRTEKNVPILLDGIVVGYVAVSDILPSNVQEERTRTARQPL